VNASGADTSSDIQPAAPESPPAVRADIIAAATRVFSRAGYHAATMTEIADEVGIRKASLYHHIRRKEDLLLAIHEQLIDELTAQMLTALEGVEDPPEKLAATLRVALSFVSRHRDGVTVFLQERRQLQGARWEAVVAKRDAYEHIVQEIIADGTRSGAFAELPPAIVAKALLGMANWGYTWFDADGPLSADEVAAIFSAIALRGLERR
jgi:TetR/AcrR family transcriptional regulator, cholesterol catabolism regulator